MIPRDYRVADTRRARVLLIEAGARAAARHARRIPRRARCSSCTSSASKCVSGKPVTQILPEGVEVGGEFLRSYNVIWAAGVQGAPLTAALGAPLRPGPAGWRWRLTARFPGTRRCSSSATRPTSSTRAGAQVPGVSQGALQMGRYVARPHRRAKCAGGAARARAAFATATTAPWRPWASRARWWRSAGCTLAACSPGSRGWRCTSPCSSASATAWRCCPRGSTVTCFSVAARG